MNYIAICEIWILLDMLEKQLFSMRFTGYRAISRAISELADCSIHIEHHSFMIVASKHTEEIGEVFEIVKQYLE